MEKLSRIVNADQCNLLAATGKLSSSEIVLKKKEEGSEMLINKVLKESENRLKARTIKRVLKKNSSKLEQVKSVSSINIKKI